MTTATSSCAAARCPNFDAESVNAAANEAEKSGLRPAIMIDASHANSSKKPENQPLVLADVGAQVAAGDRRIIGVMAESNLVAGRQDLVAGKELVYGQSITDGCIDWDTTVTVLESLAEAVEAAPPRHRPVGRLNHRLCLAFLLPLREKVARSAG